MRPVLRVLRRLRGDRLTPAARWCGVLLAATACVAAVSATRAQVPAEKKAYLLVQVDVTNPQQYAEYAKLTPDIVTKYGGRYLARGGRTETLEGPPARSRVVVLEFPSFERARAFYRSPEYTAARKAREGASTAQFVIVEAQ